MHPSFSVQGVLVPALIYGTAWKEERTDELVATAISAGFRGIDTANQRKHYFEAGTGAALANAGVARRELFLQTKFTYSRGQDHRLPYDLTAPLATQVQQSFASSLQHLGVAEIDSLLLHGPQSERGWSSADREVWSTMEELHAKGQVKLLGVSNVSVDQFEALCRHATVAPAFVQNRCYAHTGWDREVRRACQVVGTLYQGFSLLTANRRELSAAAVLAVAKQHHLTVAQLVFGFARALGIVALTGTSSRTHMDEDLLANAAALAADEVAWLERLDEEI